MKKIELFHMLYYYQIIKKEGFKMLSRTLNDIPAVQACFNGMLRMCPNNKTWKWGTVIYSRDDREVTFVLTHTNDATERVTIKDHIPGVTIDTIENVVNSYFRFDVAKLGGGEVPPNMKLIKWKADGYV